ncbi:MAG: ABC transporter ATP-binding protein [Candidatus Hermodarchaeia archaeon]|jgi:putative ABC transport system ATP-binding protein
MAYIEVKDLVRVYRMGDVEVRALRGLNMSVREGELISVMGPSGSGKTTLLNILGGLDRSTAGEAKVGDVDVTFLDRRQLVMYRRRVVGHIFQTLNLVPTLSAAENIALPMIVNQIPKRDRQSRIDELLETVQLADRRKHKPDELSGGEQQRVAIAAAIANDPPIILADEPTGELDSETSQVIVDFLVQINKKYNKTTILVTHNPIVAAASERILRIDDGVIKAAYTPAELEAGAEGRTVSYVDQMRQRIKKLSVELDELDKKFRKGAVTGDEYVEERLRLKAAIRGLEDEVHRHGG